jgi:uncharacterized protein (TIGR02757 family)
LDEEMLKRDTSDELSYSQPDPLLVASRYSDEYIALACALFGYGSAKLIVKFLDSLDFNLLDQDENTIQKSLDNHYYRFQSSKDIIEFFITLSQLKKECSLEDIFYEAYRKENNILEGLDKLIQTIQNTNLYTSSGYRFLIGSRPKKDKNNQIKIVGSSTYKRYNMWLRWMVRIDKLDMGLWTKVDSKDLLMPLDTHTFKISQKLGLLKRKTYDLKAVVELTNTLKSFDPNDPVKYDFALYRIGQEKLI